MGRYPQKHDGAKRSLKWIQDFVNGRPTEFDAAIHSASKGKIKTPIDWKSPLAGDKYAEYRDSAFLDLLNLHLPNRTLKSFWPRYGPQWDALGMDSYGTPILVEAEANVPEIITDPTSATEPSRTLIRASLAETADHLRVKSTCDWSGTFYQYANRLAHLYLLQELNGIDTWLVFVYFIGESDGDGPTSEAEWRAAIDILHGALGLNRHRLLNRVVDVFIDVRRSK